MRLVTRCITAVLQEQLALTVTLGQLGSHEAIFLLGIDIADKTFLGLEVKGDGVVLVGIVTHLKYRCAELLTRRVLRTRSMHQTRVQRHVNLVARQVHVLIGYVRLAKQMSNTRLCLVGQRVLSRVCHRSVDAILAVTIDGVQRQRVVYRLVVYPNSLMQ